MENSEFQSRISILEAENAFLKSLLAIEALIKVYPRKTENGNGTYLLDIHMDHALPEYLQYDFGLAKE